MKGLSETMELRPHFQTPLNAEGARIAIKRALQRHGKARFIDLIPPGGKVLDIGCGNDSPSRTKRQRPDIFYIGLDIGDYNQRVSADQVADRYIVTSPGEFADEIRALEGQLDAVISSHNLEHCDEPDAVLRAMCRSLKPGGILYLSFPSEASVSFPSRRGTLNYYDDATHRDVPEFDKVRAAVRDEGLQISVSLERYRPALLMIAGAIVEPYSSLRKRVVSGVTWALYGFESVIWASRPA
jgi:SAM-dependent methyltransferase